MASDQTKSPGQLDYESDLVRVPSYHDGTPRKPWAALDDVARWSWERWPRPDHGVDHAAG